ncbi:hypothetical protein [Paenibacillus wenxiniae]|uniref:KTSC domain-containing protein n=1 Tax=Paenibacillus wenxiniae TaxID=1636843 RepID=A0ABW4RCP2_9BACL
MRQSFDAWVDKQNQLPINKFYTDSDGTVVYALYQDNEGYVHFNDIAPHTEPDKMPVTEFHHRFKPERSLTDATE